MNNQEAYKQAKERLEVKYGFYVHLFVYLAVILLLFIVNVTSTAESYWFQYPMFGWGIGVFFHALSVFVFGGRKTLISERMIRNEMKKEV